MQKRSSTGNTIVIGTKVEKLRDGGSVVMGKVVTMSRIVMENECGLGW